MGKTGTDGRRNVLLGVVVGLVVGWLGGSLMQSVCVVGSSQPAATPPPRHVAALPDRPSRLLYAEELRPRLDACTFEAVVSRGHDVQHCPQCAAMMCTEECRYDGSWCGRARDFACATADRLPADSVAFFPSISADPFPVPRCHFMAMDPWDMSPSGPGTGSGPWRLGQVLRSELYALVRTHATLVEQRLSSAASQCAAHLVYDSRLTGKSALYNEAQASLAPAQQAAPLTPMLMVGEENEFLAKLAINLRPATYVEWGSGGTTNWITPLAHRSYSIEHYERYCDAGATSPVQRCLKDAGRLTSVCSPRLSKERSQEGQNYVRAIDAFQEPTFDLVLVDGRARLACALYVMRYLTDDSVVVIHDLMPRIMNADAASKLGKLDVLFKYYDLIGHTRTIAAFRRKPGGVRPHDGEWREHIAGFHLRPY